jgi:hypothetical protein
MEMDGNMWPALGAGAAGAVALTALHETTRRFVDRAPRMDVLGMRGLERLLRAAGLRVPDEPTLRQLALMGDIVSNTVYYAAVAAGRPDGAWRRGLLLGLAAGAGALVLPRPLGLGDPPDSEHQANRVLTVALYVAGGLVAAAAARRGSEGKGLERARNA